MRGIGRAFSGEAYGIGRWGWENCRVWLRELEGSNERRLDIRPARLCLVCGTGSSDGGLNMAFRESGMSLLRSSRSTKSTKSTKHLFTAETLCIAYPMRWRLFRLPTLLTSVPVADGGTGQSMAKE